MAPRSILSDTVPLLGALALFGACTTTLETRVLRPAPVSFGQARSLSLVALTGGPSPPRALIDELYAQVGRRGWWALADRTHEGIAVRIAPGEVRADGGRAPQLPDEVYLALGVRAFGARTETRSETVKNEEGKEFIHAVGYHHAELAFDATTVDVSNRPSLAEAVYVGRHTARVTEQAMPSVVHAAIASAVAQLLADITPRWVTSSIALDDDDRYDRMNDLADDGHLGQAIAVARKHLEAHPDDAGAAHNLGAFLDASGRYEEALPFYDQAVAGSSKGLYAKNRRACGNRLAMTRAMTRLPERPASRDREALMGLWSGESATLRFDPNGDYAWNMERPCAKRPCPVRETRGRYTVDGDLIHLRPRGEAPESLAFKVLSNPTELWVWSERYGLEWTLQPAR